MLRVVLSIVGIVATIGVLMWFFGITMPQVTTSLPALSRSVMRTVGLMQSGATENGREPAGGNPSGPPNTAPANPNSASVPPGGAPPSATKRSDQPEIISPDTTAHLNPDHIRDIPQPTSPLTPAPGDGSAFNPNPQAFVAPNPLPAHPHWAWDVGNREFTNVVVTHVDADLVTIASDSGTAQIDIALLPLEIRSELNYDPALASQATAARNAQADTAALHHP